MEDGKIVSLEDRIPKLKQQRRRKANRRLISLLSLFFVLIAFVIYFQSPLSQVKSIHFSGNTMYSKEELMRASGLSEGRNLWTLDRKQVARELKRLPEVKTAKVSWKFPNHLKIQLTEYERIAYVLKGNEYSPVLDNGKILDELEGEHATINAPILVNFQEGDVLIEMVKSLQLLPKVVTLSISEVHYTPKKNDKYHINLFMNDGNEVSASLRSFADKMVHYPSIVNQLDPAIKGIIDLEVGTYFQSYEPVLEGNEASEEKGEG